MSFDSDVNTQNNVFTHIERGYDTDEHDITSLNGELDEYDDLNVSSEGWDDEYVTSNRSFNKKIYNGEYKYNALSDMKHNIEEISDDIRKVVYVLYKINTDGKYPFLEFGFSFSSESHLYHFIECERTEMDDVLPQLNNLKGYIENGPTAYLFYHLESNSEMQSMMKLLFPDVHFILSSEIMNVKRVMKCHLHHDIIEFFSMHPQTLLLENEYNEPIELPVVAYCGSRTSDIEFIRALGVSPSEQSSPFGVGYYFTNFENAKKNATQDAGDSIWNPAYCLDKTEDENGSKNEKSGGVVSRFAIFPGRMKVQMNTPDDVADNSSMKQYFINKSNTNHFAKMTMRVTDHDGLWKDNFDSIYAGKVELDDGSLFHDGPIWCMKEFNQQLFLTFQLC